MTYKGVMRTRIGSSDSIAKATKRRRAANRIRQLRTKLGLSQRALAKKVDVSQQHLQRLETSDDVNVGFLLATRLCQALGAPLDIVFPQTRTILSSLPAAEEGRRRSIDPLFYDRKVRESMGKAGIDMDVTPWYIAMKLRGRAETVDVLLADGEYSRLWSVLQREPVGDSFVVFESADRYRMRCSKGT